MEFAYRNKDYQNAYDEFTFLFYRIIQKALMANAYLLFSENYQEIFARANKYLASILKYARAIYLQGLRKNTKRPKPI